MTKHLPECERWFTLPECANGNYWFNWCICPALRACEQRVLDAALEAVKQVCVDLNPDGNRSTKGNRWVTEKVAVAVIDALRGESND